MIVSRELRYVYLYECEGCHTKYKDRSKCIQCEASHVKGLKIVASKFVPLANNRNGFPVWVQIMNEKGETRKYLLGK